MHLDFDLDIVARQMLDALIWPLPVRIEAGESGCMRFI
jgi:hypothetical protein